MTFRACFFVLQASFLLIATSALAQSGRWVASDSKFWSISQDLGSLGFADSTFGFATVDSDYFYRYLLRTVDGGKSWRSSCLVAGHAVFPIPHSLSIPDPSVVYSIEGAGITAAYDSGTQLRMIQKPWRGFYARAGSMLTASYGVVLGTDPNHPKFLEVYTTSDSGSTFSLAAQDTSGNMRLVDAAILDSAHILALVQLGARAKLLESHDLGATWDSLYHPIRFDNVHSIVTSTDPHALYIVGGGLSYFESAQSPVYGPSIIKTHDGGLSWQDDSSIYGDRIGRLCCPTPNVLWAIVHTRYPDHQGEPDTLYYSSDDGATWTPEPSLYGFRLLDLCWPDSSHGFVLVKRNDTAFVFRFVSGKVDVHAPDNIDPVQGLRIVEQPVGANLRYEWNTAGAVELSVIDMLGREHIRAGGSLAKGTLNVADLAPGTYLLRAHSTAPETSLTIFQRR